jgi:C-terminal processing protease CtpA/Prc
MLKYTIGNWYLPNDTSIDEVGLTPDVEVTFDRDLFSASGVDLQLQKALEILDDPQYRAESD